MSGNGSKYEAIEGVLDEVLKLMEDLYQSGFDTVHDSTLRDLEKMTGLAGQYGMAYLSGLLRQMTDELSAGRHRTEELRNMAEKKGLVAKLYTDLNEYLYLSRQKVIYDLGKHYYLETEWEEELEFDEEPDVD